MKRRLKPKKGKASKRKLLRITKKKNRSPRSIKSAKLTEEEIFDFIQDKAYRLWDEAGKPQGRDWEFWFKAEEKVKAHLKKIGKL